MSMRHKVCKAGTVIESNASVLKPLIHLSGMFSGIRRIPPGQIGSAKLRRPSRFDVTQTDRVHNLLFLSQRGFQQCDGFLHRIWGVEGNQDLAEFAIYGLACCRIQRRNIVDDLLCDVGGGNSMPRDRNFDHSQLIQRLLFRQFGERKRCQSLQDTRLSLGSSKSSQRQQRRERSVRLLFRQCLRLPLFNRIAFNGHTSGVADVSIGALKMGPCKLHGRRIRTHIEGLQLVPQVSRVAACFVLQFSLCSRC